MPCEAAAEGTLEDGLVSLDEENVLEKYASHFALTQQDLDGNGAQTSLVQAAVIRDVTQGIVPQRQTITGAVPFNLMKSETWYGSSRTSTTWRLSCAGRLLELRQVRGELDDQ